MRMTVTNSSACLDASSSMPRYELHIVEDIEIEDPEGVELPGLEAAREQVL
jgi:hypothetical protein